MNKMELYAFLMQRLVTDRERPQRDARSFGCSWLTNELEKNMVISKLENGNWRMVRLLIVELYQDGLVELNDSPLHCGCCKILTPVEIARKRLGL